MVDWSIMDFTPLSSGRQRYLGRKLHKRAEKMLQRWRKHRFSPRWAKKGSRVGLGDSFLKHARDE